MIVSAIVGCGYWGPNLLRNLCALPECSVKYACDASPVRLSHMKKVYPHVETTTSYERLLDDPTVDAILIATPVRFHHDMARAALLAGKHVFVEKPMAASVEQCAELVRLADARGLTLMVGHTFLYTAAVAKIKEIVDSGALGPLCYINARRLNLGLLQKDVNVAWDLAPHDISIMLHVLGAQATAVSCTGKAHVRAGIEEVTCMSIEFEDKGFGIIHSSWLDPNKVREMTFVGGRGMLVYNDLAGSEKIRVYDKHVSTPPHYDNFAEFQYSYHYGDMYAPYFVEMEPLKAVCQHFIECVESGRTPRTDGEAGMRVVEILEAASLSLRNGGTRVAIAPAAKELQLTFSAGALP